MSSDNQERQPTLAEKGAPVDDDHKIDDAGNELATATEDVRISSNRFMRVINYILAFAIPGLGMFCEAYFVFSVGNLKAIWQVEYPECWSLHTTCSPKLPESVSYTQVSGIIFGQLALGFAADRMGRKLGSCVTAGTMFIFGILLAGSYGKTDASLFAMFTAIQFLFGIGVGGEYPVASASANERAESTKTLSNRRGETVVCVFSMQGWGNLVNTLVIAILMACLGQFSYPYNNKSLEIVWRTSYAIGLIPLAFILYWRVFVLKESVVWKSKRQALKAMNLTKKKEQRRKYGLLVTHYWHRNFGTALSWFVWDFAFYGNKLFQGTFIKILNPYASLFEVLMWTVLNSFVALCGYYVAAFTIDKPWMGRTRMQAMGFMWIGFLFLMCSMFYHELVTKPLIHSFQFLYYFSSFWGQFGPNATTWLLPAELAPTEVRSQCHGLSAAVGKAGALVAGVVFSLCSNQAKFIISSACGLVGAVVTYLFIPDLTGLDLREGDKRWLAFLDGKPESYTGEAVNPKHLSIFERMLGYGKSYHATGVSTKGDHHTKVWAVNGLVVGTEPEEGDGPDEIVEAKTQAKIAKESSFQAKSLQYM